MEEKLPEFLDAKRDTVMAFTFCDKYKKFYSLLFVSFCPHHS